MNIFRIYSCIFILVFLSAYSQAQKMGKLEEVGDIPLKIEAEGFLWQRLGLQGYAERPGFFYDPVGDHRKNKAQSVIFGGNRVRLGIIASEARLKRPNQYYYKIYNSKGSDVTLSVYPALGKTSNSIRAEMLKDSETLLDTTLGIADYLFADFYDSRTDTLIKSYYLKHLRFYPKLAKNQKNGFISKPDTTVTFEFDNKDRLPDSSLEYRLISNQDTSVWKTNGFTLRFDYLKTNAYYKLEARYTFQPETIGQYSFTIGPDWYQRGWFRWLTFGMIIFIFALTSRETKVVAKRKQEAIQQKLRIVQSQLNPHFIFNSLSSIQAMINTGRITEANDYLSKFSTLMRSTLNGSDKIYNPLDTEISILDTYLKLEQIRFGFDYKITVQHGLNSSEIEVPVLIFQPMVENAVKHGVSGLKEMGHINIHFFTEGRKFICRIGDNGQGYSQQQQEYGYGFRLTHDRIKLINEMTKQKSVELEVESSEGTVIKVIFNDWL
jgi:anti-sigma regulatory factor (Ser/Thr protein kinase)